MSWSLSDYEKGMYNNPRRTTFKVVRSLIALGIFLSVIGYFFGWFSEAAQVAQEEFGAKASLKKYEWFQDCANTIEEKSNTIKVYESNIANMNEMYGDSPRIEWDRIDKQQYNQWSAEITGIKASYNKVVKEYNSQSSKFNWSMYNESELPKKYDLYLDF